TEQQKVMARYSLILSDTSLQHGDFAKNSGELENRQRILKAQLTDLSAKLGSALLPIVQRVVGVFQDVAEWASRNTTIVKVLVGVVGGLAGAVLTINKALAAFRAVMALVNV